MRAAFFALSNGLSFLAAFAAACLGLRELIPVSQATEVAQRLEEVAARRGDLDMVFIGSSRVLHHFDPVLFDAELTARGFRFHSYNLGFDGMRPPESLYFTRELLALRPQVKWVFFELWDFFARADIIDQRTARVVAWHDFRHTRMALQDLMFRRFARKETALEAFQHLKHFASRMTGTGRASDRLSALLSPPRPRPPTKAALPAMGGFVPIDKSMFSATDSVAGFEARVKALKLHRHESSLSPTLRDGLRELISEIHAAGANPVFVIMPTVVDGEGISDLGTQGISASLISFADPNRFPELYQTDVHSNGYHLNAKGAALMTRMLAAEFVNLLAQHAPEPVRGAEELH